MFLVIMGVSGSGKTTVGRRLAESLGWPFYDADDFHSPACVAKMARGEALDDGDRGPWLDRLHALIAESVTAGRDGVLACSALKARYRDHLAGNLDQVCVVFLRADRALLERRLRERRAHFFAPALLDSQLDTLEEPTDALVVSADQPVEALVAEIRDTLGR
ncbi:gluconokinase [Haliangium ochraceum]|uniref:gluconokinase n=1 Tax=Haliangium ochraceum TaxID=80816 RepID=UPI00019BB1F2|nr:gluconokinase [Haliangium ochraceum]